jgi:deoxycytidine triphosphate deaminase
MVILEGNQTAKLLKNLVYEKKQIHSESVDLTVKSISRLCSTGSLDFGGSEFAPGERETIEPKKSDESEEYGWWALDEGDYFVEYNEDLFLQAEHFAIIQPHERIVEAGITHGMRLITEPDEKLISVIRVGRAGIRIKENARVSKLILLKSSLTATI